MNAQAELTFSQAPQKNPLIYKVMVIMGLMSIIGGLLTGVMTYMNVGYSNTFFIDWRNALLSAFAVMPIGILLMALITKAINQILPDASAHKRNLITGGIMACIMESLLAFSTAANTVGFSNYANFLTAWLQGFLAALPVGLAIMATLSMTIKPKIEQFIKS
jgi:hypothetical protein